MPKKIPPQNQIHSSVSHLRRKDRKVLVNCEAYMRFLFKSGYSSKSNFMTKLNCCLIRVNIWTRKCVKIWRAPKDPADPEDPEDPAHSSEDK